MNPAIMAAAVTLMWDPSADATLYRVHVGIQSMMAGNPPLVSYSAPLPPYDVQGLEYGTQYYFTVTAINATGLESGYSNEITWLPVPPPTPTPTPMATPTPAPTATPMPEPTPDQPPWKYGWWK